jgi:hypothetical protein
VSRHAALGAVLWLLVAPLAAEAQPGTEDGLPGKRVELLSEAVPNVTRIGALWNPDARSLERQITDVRAAAAARKVTLLTFEVRSVGELDGAFRAMSKARIGGLIVVVDPLTFRYREDVVRLAAQARLPTVYGFSEFARVGGLMAFGPSVPDQAFRAAAYVDKILQGAKPADLPVERPMRFELVINMRAAKALGITIPPPCCSGRIGLSSDQRPLLPRWRAFLAANDIEVAGVEFIVDEAGHAFHLRHQHQYVLQSRRRGQGRPPRHGHRRELSRRPARGGTTAAG